MVEKSSVSVLSPSKYKSKHDSAIANFGIPDYGGSIIGVVVRPSKNVMACDPFDETFKSSSGRPVFLLVDRGGMFRYMFVGLLSESNSFRLCFRLMTVIYEFPPNNF